MADTPSEQVIVYALHDFEAENPDELSFRQGEAIVVIEKDELYSDGWWQGENIRGERGLFPQTYTSASPVSQQPPHHPDLHHSLSQAVTAALPSAAAVAAAHHHGASPADGSSVPAANNRSEGAAGKDLGDAPEMRATINEVQNHLDEMKRRSGDSSAAAAAGQAATRSATPPPTLKAPAVYTPASDSASMTSRSTRDDASSTMDRDADDSTSGQGGATGTSAKDNLMRNVQREQEREERRRKAEEQAREEERARLAAGAPPIEGIVLSDESDNEDDDAIDDESEDDAAPSRRHTAGPNDLQGLGVFKAQPSTESSSSPAQANTARFSGGASGIPLPESPRVGSTAASATGGSPASARISTDPATFVGQELADTPTHQRLPSTSSSLYKSTTSTQPLSAVDPGVYAIPTPPPVSPAGLPAGLPAVSESSSTGTRGVSSSFPPPAGFTHVAQPSSPYQFSAGTSSQPSSNFGSGYTPATTVMQEVSPRSDTFKSIQNTQSDPREWTVDQVVEWGQSKGFDSGILAKFREHEISGDVLVDMNVNTLKELDIIAFGPRARIAKAIKELRAIYEPLSALSPMESIDGGSFRGSAPSSSHGDRDRYFSGQIPEEGDLPSQYAGLGLQPVAAGAGVGAGAGAVVAGGSQSIERTSSSSTATPRSSRLRETTADTEGTFHSATEEGNEQLREAQALTSDQVKERPGRNSISSAVSGAFGFHARQKSATVQPAAEKTAAEQDAAKTGKGGIFGARTRKPPPQYMSERDLASSATEKSAAQGPKSAAITQSPSSKGFGSRFFSSSSPSQSPTQQNINKGAISAPVNNDAPTSSVQTAQAPLKRDVRAAATPPLTSPLTCVQTQADKIGTPDFAGYLRKRNERYNTWKERYMILKGHHLYVLKGPSEKTTKAWIDLSGYKFVSDGTVGSGIGDKSRYGFKAIHDTKPTHFFSSSDSVTIRNWMKALMKATIDRDYTSPVTSSANIKTIPLSVAQAMNPPPRPPSPTSAIRVQKASLTGNPNTLSAQDAAKLMGAASVPASTPGAFSNGSFVTPTGGMGNVPTNKRKSAASFLPPLRTSTRKKAVSAASPQTQQSPTFGEFDPQDRRPSDTSEQMFYSPEQPAGAFEQQPQASAGMGLSSSKGPNSASQDMLDWVNDHLPMGVSKAFDWSDLQSGRIYTRLVENLSGKSSGVKDADFEKYVPTQPGKAPDMRYIDTLFRCFDFLLDQRINTDNVSINDLMSGNHQHMVQLAESIKHRFEN